MSEYRPESRGNNPKYESVDTAALDNGVVGDGNTVQKIYGSREQTVSIDNQGSVDITGLDSTYNRYIIHFTALIPSQTEDDFGVRVSSDGGDTFESEASDYNYGIQMIFDNGSNGTEAAQGDSKVLLHRTADSVTSNGGDAGLSGYAIIHHPSNARKTKIQYETSQEVSDNIVQNSGAGLYNTAEVIDAVQITALNGDIASGEVQVYGVMS